jgi:transcriptional regulator with XRE-family HTH domain
MEKSNNNYISMSDTAFLTKIGFFIQSTRLSQNKTQHQLSIDAGLNRSTVSQIENGGGGTLISLIRILRTLNRLDLLDQFNVGPIISPLKLAKIEVKKRQRARNNDPKDDYKSNW